MNSRLPSFDRGFQVLCDQLVKNCKVFIHDSSNSNEQLLILKLREFEKFIENDTRNRVSYMINDSHVLQYISNVPKASYVSIDILEEASNFFCNIIQYMIEKSEFTEIQYKSIVINTEFFLSLLIPLPESFKRTRYLLPLIQNLLLTYVTYPILMQSLQEVYDLQQNNIKVIASFDIIRNYWNIKISLEAEGVVNAFNGNLSQLTRFYVQFLNNYQFVSDEFFNSQFINSLMKRIDIILSNVDYEERFINYNGSIKIEPFTENESYKTLDIVLRVFASLSQMLTDTAIINRFIEVGCHVVRKIFESYEKNQNTMLISMVFKCLKIFMKSKNLTLVLNLTVTSPSYICMLWSSAFCFKEFETITRNSTTSRICHDYFIDWMNYLLESITANLVVKKLFFVQIKDKAFERKDWASVILFHNLKIEISKTEKIAERLYNSLFEELSEVYHIQDLNYDSELIKILVARLNLYYCFKPDENKSLINFLISLMIRCYGLPLILSYSPLGEACFELSFKTFDSVSNMSEKQMSALFENDDYITISDSFQKWFSTIQNKEDTKINNRNNFEANNILLKEFFIQLYILVNSCEIKGLYAL